MNNLVRFSLLGALLASSASLALADTISLGSFATGTTAASLGFSTSQTAMNFAGFTAFATPPAVATTPTLLNGTADTFSLAPLSVWGAAMGNSSWVGSAANAGPGGVNPAYGYYQYTTSFTAIGGALYSGTLNVMADDTAEILLNGIVIVPFGTLGSDSHCADSGVSCQAGTIFNLSGLTLLAGTDANQLTFIVEQGGKVDSPGDPSGLNFIGTLTSPSGIAPEPNSLVLLGTGLMGAAGLMFRRRQTQVV